MHLFSIKLNAMAKLLISRNVEIGYREFFIHYTFFINMKNQKEMNIQAEIAQKLNSLLHNKPDSKISYLLIIYLLSNIFPSLLQRFDQLQIKVALQVDLNFWKHCHSCILRVNKQKKHPPLKFL